MTIKKISDEHRKQGFEKQAIDYTMREQKRKEDEESGMDIEELRRLYGTGDYPIDNGENWRERANRMVFREIMEDIYRNFKNSPQVQMTWVKPVGEQFGVDKKRCDNAAQSATKVYEVASGRGSYGYFFVKDGS